MTDHDPDPAVERRLHRALSDHAARIHPDPHAFDRIEEQLMNTRTSRLTSSQRWILGGTAATAAVLIVVALIASSLGGDDPAITAADDTTSTTLTTTTTEPDGTTTTTTFTSPVDAFAVAFPSPADSRRFDEPAAAARAFATDVLGFTRLDIGPAIVDGDEAVVEVQARTDGPVTTIELSRLGEGTWFVLGSTAADIVVTEPAVGASLATPFATSGLALAFEGTVDVLVLTQDGRAPLGTGFVMGSGSPPAGPFEGRLFFSPPDAPQPGVLVYRTLSPEDGHVELAVSFPVRLTDQTAPTPPEEDCGDTAEEADGQQPDDPSTRIVKVYFHCGLDFDEVLALRRTVPADDPAILQATLRELLAGPTDAERDAGFVSVFPIDGAAIVDVIIDAGVAEIDLSPETSALANSSANILVLREQLLRTATQFSSVAAVQVTFGGSCDAFAEWSQSDSCLITNDETGDG